MELLEFCKLDALGCKPTSGISEDVGCARSAEPVHLVPLRRSMFQCNNVQQFVVHEMS